MKTISLKVPDALNLMLNRLAKQRDQTKSEVVREALEQFLKGGINSNKSVSALELAGDWVGCGKGPGDLSTNPKYMEGFGE